MKIGLVILHADAARGGAERYTIDIAHALLDRGHDVTLLASSFAPDISPAIHRLPLEATSSIKTWRYEQFLTGLEMHLSATPYDIVHAMLPVRKCDVYHPHAGLAAAAIEHGHEKHTGVKRLGAQVLNRLNPKRQRFASIEHQLLDTPDPPVVICLSDYIQRAVREYYPTLRDRDLATLFNAVDLQKFDPTSRPEARVQTREKLHIHASDVVGLIIAQDFERKGLREAIVAMAQANERRIRLVVVGKENASAYADLAQLMGVADRVVLPGPTTDVYSFYASADFFVLPTRHDPCSLVVLEALAMGLPVISTKQNGATEIMENGVDGFVLESASDIDGLAQAMRALCDDATRQRMSAACLRKRDRLSFDRHMDELLRIYQSKCGQA